MFYLKFVPNLATNSVSEKPCQKTKVVGENSQQKATTVNQGQINKCSNVQGI